MTELFWNIFEKSGNLDAFLAYKEFSELKQNEPTATDTNIRNYRLQQFQNR